MLFLCFAIDYLLCCCLILDLVYFSLYFGIMPVREFLKNEAYWWEYWVNDLAKNWFPHSKKKKKKLLAYWPNTPRLIFAVFFRHKQISLQQIFWFSDKILRGPWATCNDLMALCIIFLFNPSPFASELIVGHQFYQKWL